MTLRVVNVATSVVLEQCWISSGDVDKASFSSSAGMGSFHVLG